MVGQIILIVGMLLACVFGLVTILKRSTETRKWAVAAFFGMFVYMAASYMMANLMNEPSFEISAAFGQNSFAFLKEATLISGAISAAGFIMTLAASGAEHLNKSLLNVFTIVMIVYIGVVATLRLHGMGILKITRVEETSGIVSASFDRGIIYTAALLVLAAALLIMSVYTITVVFRSKELISGAIHFAAVVSLWFPIVIALAAFGIVPAFVVDITVLAGGILLFLIVLAFDYTDVRDFGRVSSLNSVSDGIIILDKSKRFVFANKTAKNLFLELAENNKEQVSGFLATLPEKGSFKRGEHIYNVVNNKYTDYSGRCDCTVISVQDITEQELRSDRLAEEAAFDSISGVSSRSGVIEKLKKVCEEQDGTLIIVSFDGFKAINNAYGHETANELLGTFGTLVRNNTNTDDIRGRFGGDMFIMFLRGCRSESVIANLTMRLEEQTSAAIKKQFGDSLSISVGVSLGAVFVPQSGRDFDRLAEIAEKEQQKIKNSGGHGYSVYSENAGSGHESLPISDETVDDTESLLISDNTSGE